MYMQIITTRFLKTTDLSVKIYSTEIIIIKNPSSDRTIESNKFKVNNTIVSSTSQQEAILIFGTV